jgi:hypothetical protein
MSSWDDEYTPTPSQLEQPSADVMVRCTECVLNLLRKHPMRYVTAGWVEDRGIGFSEHTIAVVLRRLFVAKKIDHILEHGFQRYAYREDLLLVLAVREKKKKKKKNNDEAPDTI